MQTVKGPDRTPEEEITRMVNEHQLALLRLCFNYLHDTALAKAAVQETFLKAYRNLQDFRHDANEKTWLSRIAINCCRDISRSSWFRHTDRSVTLDMLLHVLFPPVYTFKIWFFHACDIRFFTSKCLLDERRETSPRFYGIKH